MSSLEPQRIPASKLFYHEGESVAAYALVRLYHYSHRRPTRSVQYVGTFHLAGGVFGDKGECVAAIIFGRPGTSRWREDLLELVRLVRVPEYIIPLTRMVSLAVQAIRRQRIADLLISYADSTHAHHGGIYQACSWNYHGQQREDVDGFMIDGKFVPARACNIDYGTSSVGKLKDKFGDRIETHYAGGKHLYWKSLSKNGESKALRLGFRKLSYPKPQKPDLTPVIEWTHDSNEENGSYQKEMLF